MRVNGGWHGLFHADVTLTCRFVLRDDGLVLPLIADRVELCPRLRISLENLFTTYIIPHNVKQYITVLENVNQ